MSQSENRLQLVESIKCKKLAFDNAKFGPRSNDRQPVAVSSEKTLKRQSSRGQQSKAGGTNSDIELNAYCYWYPKLFGVDEEFIPSSDEEGVFEELYDNEELKERANALTPHEIQQVRECVGDSASDETLMKIWMKNQVPRYGRRAKAKPILERQDNKEEFECICDIDRSFSRHYVPHYGGGAEGPDAELKTPHFIAFWESFREKAAQTLDLGEWEKVIEPKPEDDDTEGKEGVLFRPIPKFPSSCRTDMKNYRQQLLSSFRPLECREIRRFRMPFSEALYLELQEDRYFESAQFFKNLVIKDYFASKNADYVPTLTHNKGRMKYLISFLKIAERFSRRKEYHKEAIILLKSGKYFNDHNENWWWLAEELYKRAVKVSRKSVIDGGKLEAISRYILGTFLLECVHRVQLAQEHLSKARDLSLGKDWNAASILNKKQDPVHKECSNYLCQALIASSKELRKCGKPEEALPLIHRSYKLGLEARTFRRDIEMETYFELGMTYQALGMLDWAKIAFKKFVEIAKLENYPRSVCDGYLELAITYRSEGDLNRCHHSLLYYLETAESHKDENLVAFANRYLGEYHLNNGNPSVAVKFFEKALESFHNQFLNSLNVPLTWWKPEYFALGHDVELSRVLIGLASGEMVTKPICNLIIRARGVKNKDETLQLINWKNKKESFTKISEFQMDDVPSYYNEEPSSGKLLNFEENSTDGIDDSEGYLKTVRFARGLSDIP